MKDLLVILVTHNSAEHIRAAVESCIRQNLSIVVVDNQSSDSTVDTLRGLAVSVVANPTNRGFAGAINQAIRSFPFPTYLLLNPDAQLLDPIEPLFRQVVEKRHTAAAGQLVDESRSPQKGFTIRRFPSPATLALEVLSINRIWPRNPINRRYRYLDIDLLQPRTVDQPAGAFLLFHRDDWIQLGGFDEQFHPVWFEDVDFCRRLVLSGGTIWYEPSVRAAHVGGHSVQKMDVGSRSQYWYGSLLKYASKHYSPAGRRAVALAVALALLPRILVGCFRLNSIKSILSSHFYIWRLAWYSFWSNER